MVSRRAMIAGAASLLAMPGVARGAGDGLPLTVRIYVPYGRNSPVAIATDLLRGALSAQLSRHVVIEIPPLPDRMQTSLRNLDTPNRNELRLVASDTLLHVLYDVREASRTSAAPSLDRLVPVATLSGGYSTVLFVAHDSPVHDWPAFAAMAQGRSLAIATSNPGNVHLRLLQQALGEGFSVVLAADREGLFQTVVEGRAAAGLVRTPAFVAFRQANPDVLRPIVTFGGDRNADLDVPTLREVTGERGLATTNSVGLFAAPGTSPEIAARLYAALTAAAADAAVQASAETLDFPLRIGDAQDLAATVERDRRVATTGQQ